MERRDFVKTSAIIGAASALPRFSFAQVKGSDRIKVGLIGCGGRGTGATCNMIEADQNVKIVAMADLFADKIPGSKKKIQDFLNKNFPEKAKDIFDSDKVKTFTGWDCCDALLKEDVDLVIEATPPVFRTPHFAKIVEAGKHAFLEKPACVDITQAREIMDLSKKATQKGMCIVTGNQRRYSGTYQDAIKRVQDGEIGDILSAQCYWNGAYYVGGYKGFENLGFDSTEYQIRKWGAFIWTSGDQIVEQHVHNLDVIMWALGDNHFPVELRGFGGRSTDLPVPMYGDRFSHFAIDFDMGNGLRLASYCQQDPKAADEVGERIVGTKGIMYSNLYGNISITDLKGNPVWKFDNKKASECMVNEHKVFLQSVRNGGRMNMIEPLVNSTLLAIAGRLSAYSGKKFKYDWMLSRSAENLVPEKMAWGVKVPLKPVPVPGKYELVLKA